MTVGPERIASCHCGEVQIRAIGKPIVSAVCYCADCQAGGRQLEEVGARHDFQDAWGGSAYLVYRDDRILGLEESAKVQGFRIREGAPTTRFVTTCCKSALYLKHGPGWWTSLYRVRFGDAAPPLEMRNNVRHVKDRATLPSDVPTYPGFPPSLFGKLLLARLGILIGT
jgi:hypothetical protein